MFIQATAHGKKIGDAALVPLYQAIDQAKELGNKQALEGLKHGVDEARNNWNGLLAADNRVEKVVNERMSRASDKDKARLLNVLEAIEKDKQIHYMDLEKSYKMLPNTQ